MNEKYGVELELLTSSFNKEIEKTKQKMSSLKKVFNPDDVSGIKITGLSEAKKEISGISKEFNKLTGLKLDLGNAYELSKYKDKMKEVSVETKKANVEANNLKYIKYDTGSIQNFINGYGQVAKKIQETKNNVQETIPKAERLSNSFKTVVVDKFRSSVNGIKNAINKVAPITNKVKTAFRKVGDVAKGLKDKIKNAFGGNQIQGGLRQILKYSLALFSLRGIYSMLSQSASAWLSSQNAGAQQLSANIDYLKYAMGSVFAPVIQYITNLVYSLLKGIQQVAYALTGVNIFAKATAKSMSSTAKSAKEASKSLAGFDELNNIDTSSSSSSGGSGAVAPTFDLSNMSEMSNSILDAIKNGDWESVGEQFATKLNTAISNTDFSKAGETFASAVNAVIDAGYGFVTTFNWSELGTKVGQFVNTAFSNIKWDTAGQTLGEGIKGILSGINSFIAEVDWKSIGESIKTFFQNIDWAGIWSAVKETIKSAIGGIDDLLTGLFGEGTATIIEAIAIAIGSVTAALTLCTVATTAFGAIIAFVTSPIGLITLAITGVVAAGIAMYKNWDTIKTKAKELWDKIKEIMGKIWDKVKEVWNNVKEKISTVVSKAKDTVKSNFETIRDKIKSSLDTVWTKVKTVWDNIKTKITSIVATVKTNIVEKFTTIKDKVKSIFESIKSTITTIWDNIWNKIKGVINSILGGIQSMSNGIVKGVNKVIQAMNNLSFTIPEWVPVMGGKTFGFNIKELQEISIPQLAVGTNYVPEDQLAYIHKGEAVVPKKFNSQEYFGRGNEETNELLERVIDAINQIEINPITTIKEVGKTAVEYINSKNRQLGRSVI